MRERERWLILTSPAPLHLTVGHPCKAVKTVGGLRHIADSPLSEIALVKCPSSLFIIPLLCQSSVCPGQRFSFFLEKNVLCPHNACVHTEGMARHHSSGLAAWLPFPNAPCTYRPLLVANCSLPFFIRLTRRGLLSADLTYRVFTHIGRYLLSNQSALGVCDFPRVSLHALGNQTVSIATSSEEPHRQHAASCPPLPRVFPAWTPPANQYSELCHHKDAPACLEVSPQANVSLYT